MFVFIAALQATGFWRCGEFFTSQGKIVDLDQFSTEQVERLKTEKMLRISEPTEEQLAAYADTGDQWSAEVRFDLTEVIKELGAGDFQKDGKPKLKELKSRMAPVEVTAELRDEVWAQLLEDGFSAPENGAAV